MTRIVFAMVVAAILTLAVSGGSQAAPIAPLYINDHLWLLAATTVLTSN
jgi:hypothetical protein